MPTRETDPPGSKCASGLYHTASEGNRDTNGVEVALGNWMASSNGWDWERPPKTEDRASISPPPLPLRPSERIHMSSMMRQGRDHPAEFKGSPTRTQTRSTDSELTGDFESRKGRGKSQGESVLARIRRWAYPTRPKRYSLQETKENVRVQREKDQESMRVIWETQILPTWTPAKRNTRRVCLLCRKGIPTSIRGQAWQKIVGNALNITEELYRIMEKRGRQLYLEATAVKCSDCRNSGDNRENSMYLIHKDATRTMPELHFFHSKTPMHDSLVAVLSAYACFRPDIGYVQGMSYLAAMFLLNMKPVSAFTGLANLLNQDIYFNLFRMDASKMKLHLRVFSECFQFYLPELVCASTRL